MSHFHKSKAPCEICVAKTGRAGADWRRPQILPVVFYWAEKLKEELSIPSSYLASQPACIPTYLCGSVCWRKCFSPYSLSTVNTGSR
eukprot:scaffold919_cov130-Cylindrotheca_fusiformis.AAC.2